MPNMPILLYDTLLDPTVITENKPYKNIADLLVNRCISVKRALKLCGAEKRVVFGDGSDYERFYTLCASMKDLVGHPVYNGVKELLSAVFGWDGEISLYTADALWQGLNEVIEESQLTPVSLLSCLNIESVSVRRSPFYEKLPKVEGIDLYTVTDLYDIYSLIVNEGKDITSLNDFISKITSDINSNVRIKLPQDYKFVRNSKKLELEEFFLCIKSDIDLSENDRNALITYVVVSVIKKCAESEVGVILECHCQSYELSSLYSYLEMNKALPISTVLICEDAEKYERFFQSFTERNPYGMPSIVPVCKNYTKLAEVFPIGHGLQYQEGITDLVSICDIISRVPSIYDTYGDDVAENLTYVNIKNRMKI